MNNTMFHQMALSNAHLTAIRVAILLSMFILPGCGQDDNQPTSEGTTKTQADLIKAAEQGDAVAQFNLGSMYRKGQGVRQDYQEAIRWFRLAAEQGDAVAQFNLGVMYYGGEGVPQDYEEALRWFRLAAEQGDAVAQFKLGVMYREGQGVPQDYEEALRWYKLAAEQGYAVAQGNLGSSYSKGEGVTQDYVLAHMWYNLATSQLSGEDRETAVRNRDIIAEKMTSEQLAEARRLAREWKPKSSGSQ